MTAVLGVNGHPGAQHDAAAAVLVDGQLVAAVEEERLCRRKHAYGLQATMAVREVLAVARLSLPEIDTVACPWLPSLMGLEPKDLEDDLRSWLSAVTGTPLSRTPAVRFVEHHAAHVWSGLAFWPCRHAASSAAVLVVDGAGESTAGAAYTFDGRQLTRLWSIAEEASLGIYYEALSRYLGSAGVRRARPWAWPPTGEWAARSRLPSSTVGSSRARPRAGFTARRHARATAH